MIRQFLRLSVATLLSINYLPAAHSSPGPIVRLMFPIINGTELESLASVAPNAKIVQVGSESFVLLGSFSDTLVAHRLGRTIQKRLAIPFDLAYDPGHPQLNLAMGGSQELERTPDTSTARRSPAVAGTDLALASRSVGSSPPIEALLGSSRQDVSRSQPSRLPPAHSEFWRPVTIEGVGVNTGSTTAARLPAGKSVVASVSEARVSSPADPQRQTPVNSDTSMRIAAEATSHPWIKPVAIEMVAKGLPISRLKPAINSSFDYLIVPIRTGDDLARLQRITSSPALTQHGEALMATMGIYTRSRLGAANRDAQLAVLQRQSFKPLLVRRGNELKIQS